MAISAAKLRETREGEKRGLQGEMGHGEALWNVFTWRTSLTFQNCQGEQIGCLLAVVASAPQSYCTAWLCIHPCLVLLDSACLQAFGAGAGHLSHCVGRCHCHCVCKGAGMETPQLYHCSGAALTCCLCCHIHPCSPASGCLSLSVTLL